MTNSIYKLEVSHKKIIRKVVKNMMNIIRKTTTAQGDNITLVKGKATGAQTTEYLIYFLFGILEILLAFRLVFKLSGASLSSTFVGWIYGLTGLFVLPFEGIFRKATSPGIETRAILEPSTLVALIVYAVVAWGIVKLIQILSREQKDY